MYRVLWWLAKSIKQINSTPGLKRDIRKSYNLAYFAQTKLNFKKNCARNQIFVKKPTPSSLVLACRRLSNRSYA
jgi:hypothetical protein